VYHQADAQLGADRLRVALHAVQGGILPECFSRRGIDSLAHRACRATSSKECSRLIRSSLKSFITASRSMTVVLCTKMGCLPGELLEPQDIVTPSLGGPN
jgi:hypothetical protein